MTIGKAASAAKGRPVRQRIVDKMLIASPDEGTQIACLFEIGRLAGHHGISPAETSGSPVFNRS